MSGYIIWAIIGIILTILFPPAGIIVLVPLIVVGMKSRYKKAKPLTGDIHTIKMQRLEHELDKIESSLDAVTTNDKVTPIWDPRKKP